MLSYLPFLPFNHVGDLSRAGHCWTLGVAGARHNVSIIGHFAQLAALIFALVPFLPNQRICTVQGASKYVVRPCLSGGNLLETLCRCFALDVDDPTFRMIFKQLILRFGSRSLAGMLAMSSRSAFRL